MKEIKKMNVVESLVIAAYPPFIKTDDISGAVSCILLLSMIYKLWQIYRHC